MELVFLSEENQEAEVLFFPVLKNEKAISGLFKALDYEDEKSILARLKKENFKGNKGQIFVIHDQAQMVVLLGSGQEKKLSLEDWRQLAGTMISYLKKYKATKIGLAAKYWLKGSGDLERLGQAIAEGLQLANYSFDKYKKPDKEKIKVNIKELFIYLDNKPASRRRDSASRGGHKVKFQKGFELGLLMAQGTVQARDLINEPAGKMTPSLLAEEAIAIAKGNKNVSVKILDKEKITKLKMGAFLSIAQGSNQEPKFIHLIYKPKGKAKAKIALVGKGLTFDSGGLNVKPWEGMNDMKIDMGGAATVLGVFSVLAQVNPKVEIHGIIAACENMASGSAIKPGDVVTNMQGKTIEIGHTDAEGRVTLADSLAYAQKQGIKKIVDIATLTGSVIAALGPQYAGLFTLDQKLAKDILKYSQLAGENLWQLPMAKEYKDTNKSQVADVKNISSMKYAGSIMAAWFLKEFIEDDVSWAHIDIAGTAYAEKPFNSYVPIGGVGFGVRTLLQWLKGF
ncbi:leucyl aminopeptidase [bacterium]|nr:leucyl aminopeptidase [bacterium]